MTTSATFATESKLEAHPFEIAGMGTGPYRFLFMWSFPSKEIQEHNPEAYNLALREMPRGLVGGCGTCSNCGMGITNVCVVEDAQGRRYGVGSDCVSKTGDKSLGDAAKVAIAKHQKRLRHAAADRRREAQRVAFLAAISTAKGSKDGETNGQRIERERIEADAAQSARNAVATKRAEIISPIVKALDGCLGDFVASVSADMKKGTVPFGRGQEIVCDIFAKQHGRRNSSAYGEAYVRASDLFEQAEAVK